MIVFGLLRKDLIRFEEGNPPRIFPKPKPQDVQPTYYEIMFMKTIKSDGTINPNSMKRTLSTLIKTVARKLEGYSRKDTRLYYQRMMTSAIQEMQQASTPELQNGAFDRYAEWLLVSPEESRRINRYDRYYVPPWYYSYFWFFHGPRYRGRHYRPRTTKEIQGIKSDPRLVEALSGSKSGSSTGGKGGGQPVGIPQIADGIATGANNFSNAMVVGFAGIANNIASKFVPPPPRPRRSSYSGRSCACACACASCACACAGGGR